MKHEKMPPINVFVDDTKQIINVIKYTCNITNFSAKRIHNTKSSIQLYSRPDYDKVLHKLKSCNVQLFTYTPKPDKTKTFVLKGLGHSDTTDEIKEALMEEISNKKSNINIIKVSRFSSAENPKQIPFFIIQTSHESSSKDIFNIKYLLYRKVTFEKLIKPDIMQCYRCQRYGHVSTQCNMQYRCVKCGKSDHLPGKCLLEIDSGRDELYCVQCKTKGHPASFRGCPKYKELIKKIRDKREQIRTESEHPNNNFIQPNTSFAQIASGQINTGYLNNNGINVTADMFAKFQKTLNIIQLQMTSFEKAQKLNAQNIDFLFDILKINKNKNIQG